MTSRYLSIDLGAESGRVMLGTLKDGRIELEELSRFSNTPIRDGDRMYWNIPALLDGIRAGLASAGALGQVITSVSADAWGVDYVLLDATGEIIEPVFHYRDPRTAEAEKTVLAKVDWPTLFEETGVQYMLLNTSIQLCAEPPARLAKAAQLLTIADAINYLLSGVGKIEMSMASTTQLYNPRLAKWSERLIDALGLPNAIFPEVAAPATTLGPLKPGLAAETGLGKLNVVASLSHDTACAVAAWPGRGRALGLHQLRHLVADGAGDSRADHHRRLPRTKLHQRDRLRRLHPIALKISSDFGLCRNAVVPGPRRVTSTATPIWLSKPLPPSRMSPCSTRPTPGSSRRMTCRNASPTLAAKPANQSPGRPGP